jgi:hypothetical protein
MTQLNENQKPIAALLIDGGYKEGSIPNEYVKRDYKAVIWHNGHVTVTKYTPTLSKYLWSETTDLEGLKEYLRIVDNNE